VPVKAQF